jgi:hypothetical protein
LQSTPYVRAGHGADTGNRVPDVKLTDLQNAPYVCLRGNSGAYYQFVTSALTLNLQLLFGKPKQRMKPEDASQAVNQDCRQIVPAASVRKLVQQHCLKFLNGQVLRQVLGDHNHRTPHAQ